MNIAIGGGKKREQRSFSLIFGSPTGLTETPLSRCSGEALAGDDATMCVCRDFSFLEGHSDFVILFFLQDGQVFSLLSVARPLGKKPTVFMFLIIRFVSTLRWFREDIHGTSIARSIG